MTSGLTRQQAKVLDFIRAFITEHGSSPSYAEIGAGLGLVSRSSIHRHVHGLVRRGVLMQPHGCPRSIALTDAGTMRLHLPPDLERRLRELAQQAGVAPEAIAIEALRDCLLLRPCSNSASQETSLSVGLPRPPETRGPVTAPRHSPTDPRINLSSEALP